MPFVASDSEAQIRTTVFAQTLQQLGSTVGRNLQIDYRFAGGEADRVRQYAAELVALAPDVIVTIGSITAGPMQQATRSIPIVFMTLADPVGAGIFQSLARPGGNATGFTTFEYT
jgi:putative ABC transport system substrate-binding protein